MWRDHVDATACWNDVCHSFLLDSFLIVSSVCSRRLRHIRLTAADLGSVFTTVLFQSEAVGGARSHTMPISTQCCFNAILISRHLWTIHQKDQTILPAASCISDEVFLSMFTRVQFWGTLREYFHFLLLHTPLVFDYFYSLVILQITSCIRAEV